MTGSNQQAKAILCIQGRTSESSEATLRGARILSTRAAQQLATDAVVVPGPADFESRSWRVDIDLAGEVLQATARAAATLKPLMLFGGHCAIALAGALPLAQSEQAHLVWFDAHPDFHDPSTTKSQFLGGMILSAVVGRWPGIKRAGLAVRALDPRRVVLAGVSDPEPPELVELHDAGIAPLRHDQLTVDALVDRVESERVVIHLDLDVLDSRLVPAEYPSVSAVNPEGLATLLEALCDSADVRAAEIVGWNGGGETLDHVERAISPLYAWAGGRLRERLEP